MALDLSIQSIENDGPTACAAMTATLMRCTDKVSESKTWPRYENPDDSAVFLASFISYFFENLDDSSVGASLAAIESSDACQADIVDDRVSGKSEVVILVLVPSELNRYPIPDEKSNCADVTPDGSSDEEVSCATPSMWVNPPLTTRLFTLFVPYHLHVGNSRCGQEDLVA